MHPNNQGQLRLSTSPDRVTWKGRKERAPNAPYPSRTRPGSLFAEATLADATTPLISANGGCRSRNAHIPDDPFFPKSLIAPIDQTTKPSLETRWVAPPPHPFVYVLCTFTSTLRTTATLNCSPKAPRYLI
ncbi:hypothetical protein MTP99_011242 [Tenebrio molitor]|jgi:hypothetical protein|nr:hypothetical protein MTP99_011242 [Tenebrio molitor]